MSGDPLLSPLWPADNPAVTGHITLLQGIITRLANNSASCKTWCLTLIAALLGIAGTAHEPKIIVTTLVPLVIFGFLDVMYLATEVAYRKHYDKVVKLIRDGKYDRGNLFDAAARPDGGHVIWALGSWSVAPYYGLLIFFVIAELAGWPALLAK